MVPFAPDRVVEGVLRQEGDGVHPQLLDFVVRHQVALQIGKQLLQPPELFLVLFEVFGVGIDNVFVELDVRGHQFALLL